MDRPNKKLTWAMIAGFLAPAAMPAVDNAAQKAYDAFFHKNNVTIEYVLGSEAEAAEKAYAGGMDKHEEELKKKSEKVGYDGEDASTVPNPFKGDPCFDYFDGGVYKWGAPDFPKDRFDYRRQLEDADGDLAQVFEQEDLYNFIGKHLDEKYKAGKMKKICFDDNNNREIGVVFKIDSEFYVGFKKIEDKDLKLIQKYNIK